MNYCVYTLIFPCGRVYVGRTNDFKRRMARYAKGELNKQHRLREAIKAAGGWSCIYQEKWMTGLTKHEADVVEGILIRKNNATGDGGFNMTCPGNASACLRAKLKERPQCRNSKRVG